MVVRAPLEAADIQRWLPHRQPLLMLDRVTDLVIGESARGTKNISIADPVFAGHFPSDPIYPGVLLVETAAQLSGIVLATTSDGPMVGYLASIKRFKFTRPVRAGDQVTVASTRRMQLGGISEFAVELSVGARSVASGSLAIALMEQ